MGKSKILLLAIIMVLVAGYFAVTYFALPDLPKTAQTRYTKILIPKGSTVSQIADSLKAKGLIRQTNLFRFWAKTLSKENAFKAGIFNVPLGLTYPQTVRWLVRAKPENIKVQLIEGWPTKRILKILSEKLFLNYGKLDSLVNDKSFCQSLNCEAVSLTGYLLPDTYFFPLGITEKGVLRFLVNRTLQIFKNDSTRYVLENTGYTVHKILTLASIIEGEALLNNERPDIASVYWNRLRRGMRLQADPTIQYLLKDGPRRLLLKDLKIKSPYNTYLHSGLPPGPINNPGKASILAALFPAHTNYLYFVAKGDGSHIFSKNAKEHAKAKAAFNRVRRIVARKKRMEKGH